MKSNVENSPQQKRNSYLEDHYRRRSNFSIIDAYHVNSPYTVNVQRAERHHFESPSAVAAANKQLVKRPNQSPLSSEFKAPSSNKLLKRSSSETFVANDVTNLDESSSLSGASANAVSVNVSSSVSASGTVKLERILHKSKSTRDFADKENTSLLSGRNSDSSQSINNRVRQFIKNNNQIKIYDMIPPHLAPPLVSSRENNKLPEPVLKR
jgi:hypothetical protein